MRAGSVAGVVRVAVAVVVASAGWVSVAGSPAAADEIRDAQWHLERLAVPEAHDLSLGAGVTVAVLDSGVDASHPDLAGNVVPGIDLTGSGSDGRDDPGGTGTALAGLIAGRGHGPAAADRNNAGADGAVLPPHGALGIAPHARILPVVVAPAGSAPAPATMAAGIDRARRSGADVICLGHAIPDDPGVIRAIGLAIDDGAVVVIPGGAESEAFARFAGLGLLSAQPQPESLSQPPDRVNLAPGAVAVPGPGLLTTGSQGGYFRYERTGAAAAAGVLAGAAALVRAAHPDLPGHQVTHRIVATATVAADPDAADPDAADPDPADPDAGGSDLDLVAALTAQVVATELTPPGPPTDPADRGARDPAGPTDPGGTTPTGPDGEPAAVAAFDSDDWRRWLVAAPLVTFLIVLATVSITAARRARRQNLLTSARAGNNEY